MEHLVTILVLAAAITVWGYCHSRWNKSSGGCGSCAALTRGGLICGRTKNSICESQPPDGDADTSEGPEQRQ